MKRYTITYEVQIDAVDIDKAEELAEKEELKRKARLEKIEGEDGEALEGVYDIE